jgi:hypothetical protein
MWSRRTRREGGRGAITCHAQCAPPLFFECCCFVSHAVGIDKLVVFALDEETERTLQDLNVAVLRLPSLEQLCPECALHQVAYIP